MKFSFFGKESRSRTKIINSGMQARKRGFLLIQAFFIVLALVMTSSAPAFASSGAAGADPRKILTEELTELTDSMIDAVSASAGAESLQDITTVSGELSYKTSVNDDGLSNLLGALEMPQEFASIARLILDAGLNIGFELDVSGIDPLIKLGVGLSVQDEGILNLESAIMKNVLYFGIAELYSKYFTVELDDYGLDVKDVIDEASGELTYSMSMDGYTQMLMGVQSVYSYIADNEDEFKVMLQEIIETAIAEIEDIDYDDDVTVSLNGNNVDCESILVDLTEADAQKIGIAVANLLLENRDYLRMIADITNITNGYKTVTVSDLKESLESFLDEEYEYFSDETVMFNLYLDSDKNIIGIDMTAEDIDISFLSDNQNGFEFYSNISDEIIRVYGSFEGELTETSGDVWLEYFPIMSSEMEAFNIKLFEFEGLNLDYYGTGAYNDVKLTYFLGELFTVLGEEALSDIPYQLIDYFLESKLVITMNSSDNTSETEFELLLGDDISLSLSLNLEIGAKFSDITIPESSDLIYLDEYFMGSIDINELFENIQNIMAKIEAMGYNIDLLYELLGSALSGM